MTEPLRPLGELASRALAAERTRPEVSVAARDRVLVRLSAAAAVGAVVGTTSVATAALAVAHATSRTPSAVGSTIKVGLLSSKLIPIVVAAFAVGGAAGYAVHAQIAGPPIAQHSPAHVAAKTEPSMDEPMADGAVSTAPAPSSAPSRSDVGLQPSAPRSTSAGRGPDAELASERALIERARMALARGQSAAALEALDAHARDHGAGRLAQEREALVIQALAMAGRRDEAQARATRFRRLFPQSVFLGAVDAVAPPGSAIAPK